MSIFELKTDANVFHSICARDVNYTIRLNDRNYAVGDILILKETLHTGADMQAGKPLVYTGRELICAISQIMFGPIYGLQKDWVILSLDANKIFDNMKFACAVPEMPLKEVIERALNVSCADKTADCVVEHWQLVKWLLELWQLRVYLGEIKKSEDGSCEKET